MSSRPLASQRRWLTKPGRAAPTLPPAPLERIRWVSAVSSRFGSHSQQAAYPLALEKSASTRWKVLGIFVKKRLYLFRSCSSSETAGVGNQSPSHHPEKQHQRQRGSKQPGVYLVFLFIFSVFCPVAQCVNCPLRGCCRRTWWKSRRSAAWAARPAAARAPRPWERPKTWRATSWKHKRRLLPSRWERSHTLFQFATWICMFWDYNVCLNSFTVTIWELLYVNDGVDCFRLLFCSAGAIRGTRRYCWR